MSTSKSERDEPTKENMRDLIIQLCKDLNQAHDEIMELQDAEPQNYDWPTWTPQANSLRWAERMFDMRLTKLKQASENPEREQYAEG
ncbi:hypothetical protein [Fodinibius sp. Rm-B-1B1-1]|uniref:hypothetical protein n=1 Tax=Fodinibius alkaliphilus TaxID=3140241 RepID=UPI00315A0505